MKKKNTGIKTAGQKRRQAKPRKKASTTATLTAHRKVAKDHRQSKTARKRVLGTEVTNSG